MNRRQIGGQNQPRSRQDRRSRRRKDHPTSTAKPPRREIDANQVVGEYYEHDSPTEEDVRDIFMESEETGNPNALQRKLKENPAGPDISADDVDAAWDRADEGEETVGGSSPTPDQDIVEEIGEAAGVSYQDAEPLRMQEKLEKRDENRWELDPASAEDYADRMSEPKETKKRRRRAS